jgi:hypothetical protein
MPYYKRRKIEITPKRQADGTWQCSYRIIEFHSTCWRFQTGSPDSSFLSRGWAIETALAEAKRIVDALDIPAKSDADSVLRWYRKKIGRFFAQARGL